MSTNASPAADTTNTDPAEATASAQVVENQDANTSADTSAAETQDAKPEAPKSLLDVVKGAVKPESTEPDASSATTDGQDPAVDPKAKAEGEAESPEAEPPFHKHPRWQQMVQERDALKPDAENYRQITTFMDQNNLAPKEVAEGFEIMALLKSGTPENLTKAREYFSTRLQTLNELLGETLPKDLQDKVEGGVIDEETAKELARTRAKTGLLDNRIQVRDQQDQEQQRQREAADLSTKMASAVNDWETRIAASDPDYATKKAKLVEDQSRAIIQRTGQVPKTADEALKLVEAAYAEVNANIKSLLPKPKAVTPAPASISARAAPVPQSLRDVVAAAVRR